MSETITVIYEQGVLRPLLPLSLPEHVPVQIQIVTPPADSARDEERHRVRQVLLSAGIIQPPAPTSEVPSVSEAQLTDAAEALAAAGPLSELIIEEREAR
jgi:predicted DNA-binding antitoxin AbrB/MazE fold protein